MSTRDAFVRDTLAWLHARVLPPGTAIDERTPLFDSGLIDSLAILRLIAWTERATGCVIPDVQIRMDNFRTVRRIAEVFVSGGAAHAVR